MIRTSAIDIDLSGLDHNLRVLRRIVGPRCGLCPILKADAYGLGAVPIAGRLARAGADMLAVYTPAQALEVLSAGLGCPVLILMPVRDLDEALREGLAERRLHLTVADRGHLEDLIRSQGRSGAAIGVHLEVDTGMSRGGCRPDEVPAILETIAASPALRLAGVFTQFVDAEGDLAATDRQMAGLDRIVAVHAALIPSDCLIHAANTFATLRHRRYHRSLVRLGLAWAGYGAELLRGDPVLEEARHLRPIITWRSTIIQTKTIEAGTSVGYRSTWTATRPSRIGLVPVGYADGYPMALGSTSAKPRPACVGVLVDSPKGCQRTGAAAQSECRPGGAYGALKEATRSDAAERNPRRRTRASVGPEGRTERYGTPALKLNRRYVPVVGAVNMDQITIDLTDLDAMDGGGARQWTGTVVELISPDPAAPNHLPTLAAAAGTIPHEIMCRLNPRIDRIYTGRSGFGVQVAAGDSPGRGSGFGFEDRISATEIVAAT